MNYTPACFLDAQRHMPCERAGREPTHYRKFKLSQAKHRSKTAPLPVYVDRKAYAKAVVNHAKNPSAENEAVFRAERAQNQRIALTTHLEAAGFLVVLVNAGWFLIRKWRM